jgi:hypothetical protein
VRKREGEGREKVSERQTHQILFFLGRRFGYFPKGGPGYEDTHLSKSQKFASPSVFGLDHH